ncbi:hypothetical protein K5O32_003947 [Escherichia coli]|nr:hypothetical protein [Escherichia coli]
MPTPSGFTTREIGISGGGDHHHSLEAAPMATTLTSECNLLVIPFNSLQRRYPALRAGTLALPGFIFC